MDLTKTVSLAAAFCFLAMAMPADAAGKGGKTPVHAQLRVKTGRVQPSVRAKPGQVVLRTRAVLKEPEADSDSRRGRTRRRPFAPVVGGRILFDYSPRRYGNWGFDISLPSGGYWRHRSYTVRPRVRPYYLCYPRRRSTRLTVEIGSLRDSLRRSSYLYEPAPSRYVRLYLPSSLPQRDRVVLDAPGEGRRIAAPPQLEEHGRFGSDLSPMLGGPPRVGLAFALGEARLKDGNFEEAAAAFSRSVAERPDDPVPKAALALALLGIDRYDSAARMLRSALGGLDLRGLRPDAAKAFGGEDAYGQPGVRLREAAEGDPSNADLQLLSAFHSFLAGRYDEAAERLWTVHDAGVVELPLVKLLLEAERRLRSGKPGADQTEAQQKVPMHEE